MAKIVLVEDESIFALDLSRTLKRLGHEVESIFDNGEDCLSFLEKNTAELILMDIHIKGGLDGIETAFRINKIKEIPVIFLTAFSDDDTVKRAKNSGSYGYIIKPVSPPELNATVEMVLTRHRMEALVHFREKLLSDIMNSLFDMMIVTDNDGTITYASNNLGQQKNDGDLVGKNFFELFSIEENSDPSLNPHWLKYKSNRIPVRVNTIDYQVGNTVHGKIYSINDLSEKIEYENKLADSIGKIHEMLEEDITSDFLASISGKLSYTNSSFRQVFEIKEQILNLVSLFRSEQEGQKILELIKTKKVLINSELNMKSAGGKNLVMVGNIYLVEENHQPLIKGYLIDITEKKQLEAQLVQSQKMEALGRLAGGVAHDINNILTIIMGFNRLLMDDCHPDTEQQSDLEGIMTACKKGADLTRQLLAFARPQGNKMEYFDVNQVLNDLKKMLMRLVGDEYRIDLVLDSEACVIYSDKSLIEQAVLNMVVNSRDAMKDGGTIQIRTRIVKYNAKKRILTGILNPGIYIELYVKDEGEGIPQELLTKILEPFFTTKEVGKGTGLGLAAVYGAVKASKGILDIQSVLKGGTEVMLYFPASDKTVANENLSDYIFTTHKKNGLILLVEDEEYLLELFGRVLTHRGYQVLSARNAGEAILLCEQHKNKLDLVVSDVVMAILDGEELSLRLKKISPRLKVLLITGSPGRIALLSETANFPFMQKPFEPEELVRRIDELLAARESQVDEKIV